MDTFGTRLKKLRNEKGVSCEQVARFITKKYGNKISRESIKAYENDERNPRPYMIEHLVEYYGTTLEYLQNGNEEKMYIYDDIEHLSRELNLSRSAVIRLKDLTVKKQGDGAAMLSDLLEMPELVDVLLFLSDMKKKITAKYNDEGRHKQQSYQRFCEEMAEGYVLRAGRKTEELLREVLGYNKLVKDGENDGKCETDGD